MCRRGRGKEARGERAFRGLLSAGLLLGAVSLAPPLFGRLFATSLWIQGEQGRTLLALFPSEIAGLWVATALLLLLALLASLRRPRLPLGLCLLCFGLLPVLFLEIGARSLINHRYEPGQNSNPYAGLVYATYPELAIALPHPFLQYVRPGRVWPREPGAALPPRWTWDKPEGVRRVLALGGSTTDSYLPAALEHALNGAAASGSRYEVLLLGTSGYSSPQLVAAFLLTGLAFDPDYVLVHAGWNDGQAWGHPPWRFRSDYSHALLPWSFPWRWDALLVRSSALYRFARWRGELAPSWVRLTGWDEVPGPRDRSGSATEQELATFRSNIELIVDVALRRGVTPVLATIPHATDGPTGDGDAAWSIEPCNRILRRIAAKQPEQILLADMDHELTGDPSMPFVDLAHVTAEGDVRKAAVAARRIIEHRRLLGSRASPTGSSMPRSWQPTPAAR